MQRHLDAYSNKAFMSFKIYRSFIFFTPPIIDIIKRLRNMAIHAGGDQDYINRETALFVKSAILCILHELGIS